MHISRVASRRQHATPANCQIDAIYRSFFRATPVFGYISSLSSRQKFTASICYLTQADISGHSNFQGKYYTTKLGHKNVPCFSLPNSNFTSYYGVTRGRPGPKRNDMIFMHCDNLNCPAHTSNSNIALLLVRKLHARLCGPCFLNYHNGNLSESDIRPWALPKRFISIQRLLMVRLAVVSRSKLAKVVKTSPTPRATIVSVSRPNGLPLKPQIRHPTGNRGCHPSSIVKWGISRDNRTSQIQVWESRNQRGHEQRVYFPSRILEWSWVS